VFRPVLTVLAGALAVSAIACGDAKLYPYTRRTPVMPRDCPTSLVGYAGVAGNTTGGSATSQPAVEVSPSDLAKLTDALALDEPMVIRLTGMLTLTDKIQIKTSNKSIIGVGTNSGLIGGGIELSGGDNIILQNLRIAKVQSAGNSDGDAIRLTTATHVWVDHCDLSSERDVAEGVYDGLVDMSHASDYVTVSWTVFHDHRDTSLVGHSDSADAQAEDTNHLHATYHHNLFRNVESGPRVRTGTIHVFNNDFEDVGIFGVASETKAVARVQRNFFERVVQWPITTDYLDMLEGQAQNQENSFKDSGPSNITMTADLVVPYTFSPDSIEGMLALISGCAGPQPSSTQP